MILSQAFSPIKAIKAVTTLFQIYFYSHRTRIIGTTFKSKIRSVSGFKVNRENTEVMSSQRLSTLFGFWILDFAFALVNSFAGWTSTLVMTHTCFDY